MSWVPHLLSPGAAAVAAAIAVPSLLVLYFLKLRRREMPVSSTFLWRKAVQDLQVNAPFQRLRRNLLLLLQLLALLALILALARPVTNYTPVSGKLIVILIDHSASMNAPDGGPGGRTRLAEAKRQALDLIAGLSKGAKATVIEFADTADVVQVYTADAALLRTAVDKVAPTDRRTALKEAYTLAGAQAQFLPAANRSAVRPDVYLFSDGRAADAASLSLDGDLKYAPIGTEAAANLAIVALEPKRNYDRPTEVQVFVRLANFGPARKASTVRLSIDGEQTKVAEVELPPARWFTSAYAAAHPNEHHDDVAKHDSVTFTVDMPTAGVLKVELANTAGDLLAADDAASVVVPPPKTLSVLLVMLAREDPFLELAFNNQGLKNAQIMTGADYEEKHPTGYDVVIFDRYTPQTLPDHGSFIWFGCAPPAGRVHVLRTANQRYQTLKNVSVLDWKRDHPILRKLQIGDLFAADMLRLVVPKEAEVLVDGVGGPMVVLDRAGRTTNLVVAFDLLKSNWPLHRVSFPLFIYYSLQYMALGSDMAVRASVTPGTAVKIPRPALDKLGPDVREVKLIGPGEESRAVPIPPTGDFVLPAMDRVGVYRTEPAVEGYEQIAVNLVDENESDLTPSPTPPGDVAVGTAAAAAAVAGGKARLDLWWWIVACGATPLLLVEWWVYTRRVHL